MGKQKEVGEAGGCASLDGKKKVMWGGRKKRENGKGNGGDGGSENKKREKRFKKLKNSKRRGVCGEARWLGRHDDERRRERVGEKHVGGGSEGVGGVVVVGCLIDGGKKHTQRGR